MISADEVGALLRAGGTLQVITRAGLITQVGGEELSHRTPTERAAVLDSAVSELGG